MTNTSRRKFGKQLAGTLAVLPITGLLAQAQTRPPIEEGSPIMVGGGGGNEEGIGKDRIPKKNRCKFKRGNGPKDYVDSAPNEEKFKEFAHLDWKIRTFRMTTVAETVEYHLVPEICTIKVNSNGNNDDVELFSNSTKMGIRVDTRKFRDPVPYDTYENPDSDSWVKRVELFGSNGRLIKRWDFDEHERCTVCVDFEPNSTMDCNSLRP